MTNKKELIIIAAIVLIVLFVYTEGRSSAKERVIASESGATPGFDGYAIASEFSGAFSQGWFGDTKAKVNALRKLDGLSSGDLKVVYNQFARNFSKRFSGQTMKQVISAEWMTWVGGENLQTKLVAKLDALGLP